MVGQVTDLMVLRRKSCASGGDHLLITIARHMSALCCDADRGKIPRRRALGSSPTSVSLTTRAGLVKLVDDEAPCSTELVFSSPGRQFLCPLAASVVNGREFNCRSEPSAWGGRQLNSRLGQEECPAGPWFRPASRGVDIEVAHCWVVSVGRGGPGVRVLTTVALASVLGLAL